MKKLFLAIFVFTLIFPAIVFAKTADPIVDDPISPINADKATITGTTDPGAKITVTGGPYELSPTYADDNGNWSKTVALIQETTNTFNIKAQDGDDDESDTVIVYIEEGEVAAQEYEAETGEDRTAPEDPELDYETILTEATGTDVTGTAEAGTTVLVDGEDSGVQVEDDGTFSVEVSLTGGDTKDKFSISVMDAAKNLSGAVKIYITSSADSENTEEETGNNEGEDTSSSSHSFNDIYGHWAEDYIAELYNLGVISGYDANTFGPDDTVTRAQVLKIALEAFDISFDPDDNSDFNDIYSSDWYYDYVNAAYSLGIIEGYDDNTFKPNEAVSRGAALKIILEAAGYSDLTSTDQDFSDISSSDWYAIYVTFASDEGIVNGYDDSTFRPRNNMTRAEVCKIVSLIMAL